MAKTQTQAPVVIATPKADNKADKARAIFSEAYAQTPVPQRKDIISRMVAEAGLTEKGAATYLQNFKKKAGLVTARA